MCSRCGINSRRNKHALCGPCNQAYLKERAKHEAIKAQQRAAARRQRVERRAYTKEFYSRQRARILELKQSLGGCTRCGFADARALDFHHRDPATKIFTIGKKGHTYAWETLLAEVAKCDLLCSNCHRIEHASE
jgi:hypothetical protein